MIDISDGLMADVDHLAQASKTGYELLSQKLPWAENMDKVAHLAGVDPIQLMLGGGDDYELAFTVSGDHQNDFERWLTSADIECTMIGTMIADTSQRMARSPDGTPLMISTRGYDHFARGTTAL